MFNNLADEPTPRIEPNRDDFFRHEVVNALGPVITDPDTEAIVKSVWDAERCMQILVNFQKNIKIPMHRTKHGVIPVDKIDIFLEDATSQPVTFERGRVLMRQFYTLWTNYFNLKHDPHYKRNFWVPKE